METRLLAKRLGIHNPQLESKTAEIVRIATSRLSGATLGQGELCKTAACMEIAGNKLGVPLDTALLYKCTGASEQVYKKTKATLQKLLGVGSSTSAKDLCIQFGCARLSLEHTVNAALAAYKERFVRRLLPAQQGHVDFGRPVFLTAAFFLVARKEKIQVDKNKLLQPLGVTSKEFLQTTAYMKELIFDYLGMEKRNSKHQFRLGSHPLQSNGGSNSEDEISSNDEEVLEEGMVGYRTDRVKQKLREYESWKAEVTGAENQAKKRKVSEKALKQATLSFNRAEEQSCVRMPLGVISSLPDSKQQSGS